jgi:hypothetical protein
LRTQRKRLAEECMVNLPGTNSMLAKEYAEKCLGSEVNVQSGSS